MKHLAIDSGKSKGQFYTPAEVSRIISKIIGISGDTLPSHTLYDPTCGSGSLLLKAADEAPNDITIYGQEMDLSTYSLARMNMILHNRTTADIRHENTLSHPQFLDSKSGSLKAFDFAVANPPFSFKSWTNGVNVQNDPFRRFDGFGFPPDKNGDYAFLLHLLASLKSTGKGAIILPHGVLFRGNAEADIRKNILNRGYIKGIIGLPPNLFYGTGIPACIIVLDKEYAQARTGIFMIDASKGFVKDGNKNRLREQDIHKIVDVFNNQIQLPNYSRMVPISEIEANSFNLNIPRYIDTQDPEDIHDIQAHLSGGIPAFDIDRLSHYWETFSSLKDDLFVPHSRPRYYELKIPQHQVRQTIFAHPQFVSYMQHVRGGFQSWKQRHEQELKNIGPDVNPKKLIRDLSEDILQVFEPLPLIDRYDVYQFLMTYWNETMQDDVYMISVDSWNAQLVPIKNKKDEFDCDLVPKSLVMQRYFAKQAEDVRQLEAQRDLITRQKEELEEEHAGEDGLLEAARTDTLKFSKASVSDRIKVIKNDPLAGEELRVLHQYLNLIEQEALANRKIKEAQVQLDRDVTTKYRDLSPDQVKVLVVEDKWYAALSRDMENELERISQVLTRRLTQLAQRYEVSLDRLKPEVEQLTLKVDQHLRKMGIQW